MYKRLSREEMNNIFLPRITHRKKFLGEKKLIPSYESLSAKYRTKYKNTSMSKLPPATAKEWAKIIGVTTNAIYNRVSTGHMIPIELND